MVWTVPVAAQEAELRRVEGRIVRPAPFVEGDTTSVVTVPSVWVTLHRVSPDLSGPLDSMRTNADGQYRFSYRPSGGPEAVYFASATYGGIAYFTNPLRDLDTRGEDAEIAVFDTTSRAFPLTVRGRHLIVGRLDSSGRRTIVEVFELSNDSTRTIIARDAEDAEPTWSFTIPDVAQELKAGQGDLPADAFVQSKGRVALFAAIAPGLKQLSVSYSVRERDFPLSIAVEHGAVVLEVLLEEAEAAASGANLVRAEPVDLEGRRFQRLLAQDVRAGSLIAISAPGSGLGGQKLYVSVLLGAIVLLMMSALLRSGLAKQRPLGATTGQRVAAVADIATPDRLARAIADLDNAFAAQERPSESVRVAYAKRREELSTALRAELARGGAGV